MFYRLMNCNVTETWNTAGNQLVYFRIVQYSIVTAVQYEYYAFK